MIVRLERREGHHVLVCTECGETCAVDRGVTVVLTHVSHVHGDPVWIDQDTGQPVDELTPAPALGRRR